MCGWTGAVFRQCFMYKMLDNGCKEIYFGLSPLPVTVANEGHWEIYVMILVVTVAGQGDNPTSTVLVLMKPYLYLWSEIFD